MNILRQSTAVDVLIGPFVDSTDGDTEETALTISSTDVLLSKNGQTMAGKNDATACAHDANGMYNCEFDATDTNTVGTIVLFVHESGALAVRHEYQVVEEAVYDVMFAENANLGTVAQGTAQSVTSTTIVLESGETFADDEIIGASVNIISASTGVGQTRLITDYVGSTDTATVDTWTTTPTGTIIYKVFATPPASASNPVAADVTSWDGTAVSTPTTAGVPEVDVILVDGAATDIATETKQDIIDTNVDQIETAVITNAAGVDISADIAALNDISVSDVLTTQMTESYASDGTAPTLAQALMLIQQSVGDFSISGTTVTVRELDGSTTAATYTLDDGTTPTSRTRAT